VIRRGLSRSASYPETVPSWDRSPLDSYSYGQVVTKAVSAGRLIVLSAVAGVLVAALLVPVIAKAGTVVRNEASKFTAAPTASIGPIPQRSEILDSSGHVLAYIYGVYGGKNASASGVDRQPVSYGQIAPVMRKAIVAIEDDRYWQDGALDLRGTIRAAVNDLRGRPVQGGSTIAQQYVKNMLILSASNPEQAQAAYADTLSRKLRELRMAVAIEHQESKQQILAGYLNDAYFGHLAYGIQVAARTYFDTTAADLTLTQAATLAGIVENPYRYDPISNPALSRERRNTVLARMAQTGAISPAVAKKAEAEPLAVHPAPPPNGCTDSLAGPAAFFCSYVEHVLMRDPALGKTPAARAKLLARGGLRITTTLNPADELAAANAVNYILPPGSGTYNPGQLADTEALIQPGTGKILAIAENSPYGVDAKAGQTVIDYAVGTQDGGWDGVQTGSSSKLFTLVTALEQGIPFGYAKSVKYSETINGYTDCAGGPAGNGPPPAFTPGQYQLVNASPGDHGAYTLYTGTTQSINTFYAHLEKKVGLCNVVHTAMDMGLRRADGTSLLKKDGGQPPADQVPSFTLGSVYVSPLSMAAAYATVAARGIYCAPVAISTITTASGKQLAAPRTGCHRVMPADVADAVNYILQGVLTQPGATAAPPAGPGGIGRPAAGKTGTSNAEGSGKGTPYAAFAGYTPGLAGYVSVFNPVSPTGDKTMIGQNSCYRSESGGLTCPGLMYGANAPAQTWHMTFDHADITGPYNFVPVPPNSPFFSKGNGQSVSRPPAKPGKGKPSPPPPSGPPSPGGGPPGPGGGPPGHGHGHG